MITAKTLKEMANEIMELTQCGGIRMYFDPEMFPDDYVYDSDKIYNFFCCCEEVAFAIYNKEYKRAEEMVDIYFNEYEINEECDTIWKVNHDMDDKQWVYKDKVMIDLCANGKYIVNVYSEFINDFVYIGKGWDSLEDAKKFVESMF